MGKIGEQVSGLTRMIMFQKLFYEPRLKIDQYIFDHLP